MCQWIDAEIRCAVVEAETRESVMQEMEERMKEMERLHAQRLDREVVFPPRNPVVV